MLPFIFKTFVLSIFEWPLKAGFTMVICILSEKNCGSRGGTGGPGPPPPPGNSQVAIGFLRNTGTDLPREAVGQLHTLEETIKTQQVVGSRYAIIADRHRPTHGTARRETASDSQKPKLQQEYN